MIQLEINGKRQSVDVPGETPLLWTLRDEMGLTGTKFGCGMALCGACTVHVDGTAVRSCSTPISTVAGKNVTTIEGLKEETKIPLQQAWIDEQVPQCGYCQSGQIMAAAALLAKTPHPTVEQINNEMSGIICRCGTYQRIRRAIQRAAAGGSSSVRTTYMDLRRAGATAREMLVSAAAAQWNIPRERCSAKSGAVMDRETNQSLKYGSLVAAAAKLPMPAEDEVQLKDPKDFKVIGHSIPRVEIPSKTDGTAEFGLDAKVPGMLYAVVARCRTFGGKVKSFDATAAKAVPGVKNVFQIEAVAEDVHSAGGVAVVADNTWAAMQGRRALKIDWDLGPHANESSATLAAAFEETAKSSGTVVRNDGDIEKLPAGSLTHIEAVYQLPFLAHAAMEPMNITVAPGSDRWESWAPTQSPQWVQSSIAKIAGIAPQRVIVHTLLSGGAFGRRYMADFPVEAAQIAKITGKPIKLVWTREDDMTHDFYRPAAYHHMTAALDGHGKPVAWRHHLLSTSINAYWDPKAPPHKSEMDGASGVPYNIPNLRVEHTNAPTGVPVAWWRSVADAMNAFAVESFIDELATAAKTDPVQFRLQLLEPSRMLKDPNAAPDDDERLSTGRLKKVLQVVAEKSGWGKPLPKGRARGVACHYSFGSYVAQVAEVSAKSDGSPKVERVFSAVDCGVVINPNGAEAQSEGAIAYEIGRAHV